MKTFVVSALLASVAVLSFADPADALFRRRRGNCCHQVSACQTGCQTGGCQPGQGAMSYDPQNQHQSNYGGQSTGAPSLPPEPSQFQGQGQGQIQGNVNGNAQPSRPAPPAQPNAKGDTTL